MRRLSILLMGVSLLAVAPEASAATTVTGADDPNAETLIEPSGSGQVSQDISVYRGNAVLVIQQMPTTKLINRVTIGDFATGAWDCTDPTGVRLRISESKTGRLFDRGFGMTSSDVEVPATPERLSFDLRPVTLKEGRSYVFGLERAWGCNYIRRVTWDHNSNVVDGTPARCDELVEEHASEFRMWHKKGENDVVACPPNWTDLPSGFNANMPTGWLGVSGSRWSWVHEGNANGCPRASQTPVAWVDPSDNSTRYACMYRQFGGLEDPDLPEFPPPPALSPVSDGWYRAPWGEGTTNLPRDLYVHLELDEEALARYYKPYLLFDWDEPWRPLALDDFFAEADGGSADHELCPSGLGNGCVELTSPDQLTGASSDAVIDIEGGGATYGEAGISNYAAPAEKCVMNRTVDCNSGPTSTLYWRVTPASETNDYRFIQYWAFYRFNYFPLPEGYPFVDPESLHHEGDWEAIAIAPTQYNSEFGAFDLASFSQHGHWYSYLRANLKCATYWGPPECGTDEIRYNLRLMTYVARGSHANYPSRCEPASNDLLDQCFQGKGYPYLEEPHDGEAGWGNNPSLYDGAGPDGLMKFPDADWVTWPGRWGAEGGPQSPGLQTQMWDQSWEACAEDNDECFAPIARPQRGAATASSSSADARRLLRGPRLRGCDDWFGGGVAFVACQHRRLVRAVGAERLSRPGQLKIKTVTHPRRAAKSASAPGLVQGMGAPLRIGDRLIVRGQPGERMTLLVRVLARHRVRDLAWDGVAIPRRAIFKLAGSPGRPLLSVAGRRLEPSRVRR